MLRVYSPVKTLLAIIPLCILFAFLFIPSIVNAETNNSSKDIYDFSRPSIKKFTDEDGLPVNSVMTLERDQRGFLWIGTQDGAAVYNGKDFRVINMPNRVASNYIYDILAAKDGSIWFATSTAGVHRLYKNEWQTFNENTGLGSNHVRVLLETFSADDKKTIWVGRRDGLSKFTDGKWENFDEKDGLPDKRVRSLIEVEEEDGTKLVWIGTYGGISVWQGDTKKVFDEKDGLPGKIVFSLLKTKDENDKQIIWAGTDKGLAKFENDEWQTFENESEILTKPVRAVGKTFKADGTLTVWVGFDGSGLAYFEKGVWKYLTEKDGLPNNMIFAFAETGSPDGSVWMSNLAAGISRFERSNWRTIDDKNGLENNIVFSFSETSLDKGNGSFWIGTYGDGLAKFQNGFWKTIKKTDGLGDNFIQSLFSTKDKNGTPIFYIGTETGLTEFQNGRFQKVGLIENEPIVEVWDIKESVNENGEKSQLFSTSLGLVRKTGDKIEKTDDKNGLPDKSVRDAIETISENGKKTLWVATYNGGLAKFSNGEWTVFDNKNGLPTNRVYTLAEIKSENSRELWVGTGGGGIAILDLNSPDSKFNIISNENSNLLPSNTVYQIFQDSKNRIYATTNKGVSRLTKNQDSYSSYVFTTEDGLPSNECISGASFIDSKNRVWVGTVGGAAVLDVENEFNDDKAEPLFLEKVFVGDEEKTLTPNSTLSYFENNITFEYVMPTNFRESATLYQTQLVGLEEKPTDWTSESRREFTFLPSGNFTFKVWAKDASGNVSGPIELPFTINPAWWQTWWAIALYFLATALIVALIAYLIYRNRLARMLEIERVRTRIATDLHDDIGASLSQISILSDVLTQDESGKNGQDQQILHTISNTSREVVGSMSEMVWAINPNRDNLLDTAQRMRRFAVETLSGTDIELDFRKQDFDEELKIDVDKRRQIYLIFKEAVNNAVKYSVCKNLKIRLSKNIGFLTLSINDDGIGFKEKGKREGNGLRNMRMRAEKIGGKLKIESVVGKGTTIILTVPLKIGSIFSKFTNNQWKKKLK